VKEFDQNFTGVVIQLEPGIAFERRSVTKKVNLRSYAANYAKQAPIAFLQIIGASLLLQLFGLATPLLTKVVVDQVVPFGLKDVLALLGIGMVILLLAQFVTSWLRGMVLLYLQTHIDMRMMLRFFEHLLALPLSFFQQRSSGDILARMSSNQAIRDILSNQLITTVLDGSFVIVYFFILLSQSRLISMLVLFLGLVQVALLLGTGRLVHNLSHRELTAQGKAQGYMAEVLRGMTTLKTMGAEHQSFERWSNLFFDQIKSTLGNLLLGLYLPTGGEIFYNDDIPLSKLNYQAVRSQFGVVTQNASLFSGSIRENITLSNPTADIKAIMNAVQMAAFHDDIMSMPMQYETYIAEDGNTLSGGQRQRLALARALVNDPILLLLDEATSALDVTTEAVIDQNLRELSCTQIIIAHRLSTVRNADVILVLDQGRIVESGSHAELVRQNGYYARLIQS
jgi:ABC-type bacteriocin/lantibiotic exporter with double-glycine peptidase domain